MAGNFVVCVTKLSYISLFVPIGITFLSYNFSAHQRSSLSHPRILLFPFEHLPDFPTDVFSPACRVPSMIWRPADFVWLLADFVWRVGDIVWLLLTDSVSVAEFVWLFATDSLSVSDIVWHPAGFVWLSGDIVWPVAEFVWRPGIMVWLLGDIVWDLASCSGCFVACLKHLATRFPRSQVQNFGK